MSSKTKSTKKKAAKKLRAQKGGKGPTKGEPKCGAERGIDYPGQVCTKISGHVDEDDTWHYSKPHKRGWRD